MIARRGISIRTKLILGSTALIVFLTTLFGVVAVLATQSFYAESTKNLKQSALAALSRRGLSTAQYLADSAAVPLLERDVDTIQQILGRVAEDAEITRAVIVRASGKFVSDVGSGAALDGKELAGSLSGASTATQTPPLGRNRDDVAAFASPISIGSRSEGFLYLELSTKRIRETEARLDRERARAVGQATTRTALLGGLSLLLGLLIATFQGIRFSGPLNGLVKVVDEVGAGDLEARADVRTGDELEVLAEHFNEMTGQVQDLLKRTAEQASMEQELRLAKQIQDTLMPERRGFVEKEVSWCGVVEPASQCGGDWWYAYLRPNGRVLLLVGDVTGHGIPSAMLTASAKACCDTMLHGDQDVPIEELMSKLDKVIYEAGKGEYVMTLFAAEFDSERRHVRFCNAGHNFPMLFREGGISSLVARGGRLGDGGGAFQVRELEILPSDCLVFYTDGVIECKNPEGEEFGVRRLKKVVRRLAGASPEEARDAIMSSAYSFFDGEPQDDDITVVVVGVS